MKKSRLFRASVLLLVISLMLSLANTTFSWFSRPESLTGKNLSLSDEYDTSVNNETISFETYELNETTGEYSIPINGTTVGFSNSVGIAAGQRKCYRTDIYNSGTDPQSVSLYLQSLTKGSNCDGLAIGVNGPSKTFKYLPSSGTTGKEQSNIYLQKVYVGLDIEESYYLPEHIWKIHYWNDSVVDGNVFWHDDYNSKRFYLNGSSAYFPVCSSDHWGGDYREYEMHAVTISAKASKMELIRSGSGVIKNNGQVQIFKNNDYTIDTTEANVKNVMTFYEYKDDLINSDYYVGSGYVGKHARLHTFYSKASVLVGNTIDLKATAWGNSITYTSSDTSVATVNSSGVVTAKKVGTAKITVKVDGPLDGNDYLEATCNLTVNNAGENSVNDVPVATNMLIEGATDAGNGVTSVYWYIKNDSTVNGMTYTIPEIYVTL